MYGQFEQGECVKNRVNVSLVCAIVVSKQRAEMCSLFLQDKQESPSCFRLYRLPLYHCSLGILSSRVIPAVSLPTVSVCLCVCLAVSALLLSVRQSANCCLMFLTLYSLQKQTLKHIFSHVHL